MSSKDIWALKFYDGMRSFELLVRYSDWGFEAEVEHLGNHLAKKLDLDFMGATRDSMVDSDE